MWNGPVELLMRPMAMMVVLAFAMGLSACRSQLADKSSAELYRMLETGGGPTRVAAAAEIGHRGGKEGEKVLMEYLHDPDATVKRQVIHSLTVDMNSSLAAPRIVLLMQDADAAVAMEAIGGLAAMDYRPALAEIKRVRETYDDAAVRKAADEAITKLERSIADKGPEKGPRPGADWQWGRAGRWGSWVRR